MKITLERSSDVARNQHKVVIDSGTDDDTIYDAQELIRCALLGYGFDQSLVDEAINNPSQ